VVCPLLSVVEQSRLLEFGYCLVCETLAVVSILYLGDARMGQPFYDWWYEHSKCLSWSAPYCLMRQGAKSPHARWFQRSICFPLLFTSFAVQCYGVENRLSPVSGGAQTFTVYFTNDSYRITPEADVVVHIAASYFSSHRDSFLLIVGHADTVGPAWYNERLSKKRARNVRDRLRGYLDKYQPNPIVKWEGEENLPYPTIDDMREPLNRCVILRITH